MKQLFLFILIASTLGCGEEARKSHEHETAQVRETVIYPHDITNQTCIWDGLYYTRASSGLPCTPNGVAAQPSYPYTTFPNANTGECARRYYEEGIPFVPVYVNGSYKCVQYGLIKTLVTRSEYTGHSYNTYYGYPPFTKPKTGVNTGYGNDCIEIEVENETVELCFS